MKQGKPRPPRPDLFRNPTESFGWLETRLLHKGWLKELGPQASTVLLFLALAADQQGASYYGRASIAIRLGLTWGEVDLALKRLLELNIVALRPWKSTDQDGVWQILPLPAPPGQRPSQPIQPQSPAEAHTSIPALQQRSLPVQVQKPPAHLAEMFEKLRQRLANIQ